MSMEPWELSDRADPTARKIADGHYNRQSKCIHCGSAPRACDCYEGSANFAPPGRCLVLRHPSPALWITSWPFAQYVKHAWAGAWVCSAFRNEGTALSSALILSALAATAWTWPAAPSVSAWRIVRRPDRSDISPIRIAMVTFVDESKTRAKRDPGRCFRRAGFVHVGRTKGGLLALGLPVESVPAAAMPSGGQMGLWARG